jgi:hypothetical protein
MEDGLFWNTRDEMAEYEKMLCERNDDDWYVPDCCLEIIGEREYRIYEMECVEVSMEYAE